MENSCNNGIVNSNDNELKPNKTQIRHYTGEVRLGNPHVKYLEEDVLYHLSLDNISHDLQQMFGDIKFVCMGGPQKRMESFAQFIMKEIGYELPVGTELKDISQRGNRYSMYKVGPVLSVNHGMGTSSINILLHELFKLLYHAKCKNPIFFRIGTCGGIGLPPGTVVVSSSAVDGMGNPYYEVPVLGKLLRRPCTFDKELVNELKSLKDSNDDYQIVDGTTMCALDFFEGQARLDGAFCSFSEDEKAKFLQQLQNSGVKNIEMEAVPFSALTYEAGIRAADICVTCVDRLKGDQISVSKDILKEWERRPQELVARFIKKQLF